MMKAQAVDLRLLFSGGNSQAHGYRQVVSETSQLGHKAELFNILQETVIFIHSAQDKTTTIIYQELLYE